MGLNNNHIFIDTNVLIGAFSGRKDDARAWMQLSSMAGRGKKLFTSALAIAQLASVFQKYKSNYEIKNIIKSIRQKVTVISFADTDIDESLSYSTTDIEDNIQYVISKKRGCKTFITNNKKDYKLFLSIRILLPREVSSIIRD